MKRSAGDALQHCPIGALELHLARMIPIDARAHTNDVATHLTTLNRCCACRNDLPERLQIDMADRSLVKTLDDVRAEARWMVLKSKEIKWHYKNIIEDSGQDMVDMLNVDAGEGEPEYISLTRTKRAEVYRNNLIDKVTNVLCFVRGIANADIQHGGTFLVSSDDRRAGVPNWWQVEWVQHSR